MAAIAALDAVTARAMRRAHLPESVGKKWNEEEERQLKTEFSGGQPVSTIATKHRRTIRAIEDRLEKLGLVQGEEQTEAATGTPPPDQEPSTDRVTIRLRPGTEVSESPGTSPRSYVLIFTRIHQIQRTIQQVPAVMVKVTGGGKNIKLGKTRTFGVMSEHDG